jgi:hypothetical protein
MPAVATCSNPRCARRYTVPDNAAGNSFVCTVCQARLIVLVPAAVRAPSAAPSQNDNAGAFDFGGGTGSSGPSGDAVTREPWYYGFLDRYAQVLKWIAILVFGGMILVVSAIGVFWCVTSIAATRGMGNAGTAAAVVSCLGAVAFWVVAILQLTLGFALSLVGVALIHLHGAWLLAPDRHLGAITARMSPVLQLQDPNVACGIPHVAVAKRSFVTAANR